MNDVQNFDSTCRVSRNVSKTEFVNSLNNEKAQKLNRPHTANSIHFLETGAAFKSIRNH